MHGKEKDELLEKLNCLLKRFRADQLGLLMKQEYAALNCRSLAKRKEKKTQEGEPYIFL